MCAKRKVIFILTIFSALIFAVSANASKTYAQTLPSPENFTFTNRCTPLEMRWDAVAGVTDYHLTRCRFRYQDSCFDPPYVQNDWVAAGTTTQTTFTDQVEPHIRGYIYAVRTHNHTTNQFSSDNYADVYDVTICSTNPTATPTPTTDPASLIPNCKNLTGPSTVNIGQDAVYRAEYTFASGGSYRGASMWHRRTGDTSYPLVPASYSITGTSATKDFHFVRHTPGIYKLYCDAKYEYPDPLAGWTLTKQCIGYGAPSDPNQGREKIYPCEGPNASMQVEVVDANQNCPDGDLGNIDCDDQGRINETDLTIMLAKWKTGDSGAVPTPSGNQRSADITNDNRVDEQDLTKLLDHWFTG